MATETPSDSANDQKLLIRNRKKGRAVWWSQGTAVRTIDSECAARPAFARSGGATALQLQYSPAFRKLGIATEIARNTEECPIEVAWRSYSAPASVNGW